MQPPNLITLDVNLRGCIFFARIALVYLQQGWVADDDKSIILLSSVAGFKETPGIPVYTVSYHSQLRNSVLTLGRRQSMAYLDLCGH